MARFDISLSNLADRFWGYFCYNVLFGSGATVILIFENVTGDSQNLNSYATRLEFIFCVLFVN